MHLRLRLASNRNFPPDFERVLAFYRQNAHKYVREREPEVLEAAIDRASLIIAEDEGGRIQGSCAQITHSDGLYSETGAVRILVNGFGLQAILMGICAFNEYIFSPPSKYIFAITAADNYPSIKNIERAGFLHDQPEASVLAAIGRKEGFPPDKRFFRFDPTKARAVRERLLQLAVNRELRRGDTKITFTLDHPLFRREILNLLEQI